MLPLEPVPIKIKCRVQYTRSERPGNYGIYTGAVELNLNAVIPEILQLYNAFLCGSICAQRTGTSAT